MVVNLSDSELAILAEMVAIERDAFFGAVCPHCTTVPVRHAGNGHQWFTHNRDRVCHATRIRARLHDFTAEAISMGC